MQSVRRLEENRLVTMDREILDFIVAGSDAICGEDGRVSAVDFARQRTIWWSHEVEGKALGLAASNGRLVVSTDQGAIYCFDGEPEPVARNVAAAEQQLKRQAAKWRRRQIRSFSRQGRVRDSVSIWARDAGDLAMSLAQTSNLHIYAVESNPEKVAVARHRLSDAGLYGSRVTVVQADPGNAPFPKYFANLVVSSESLSATPSAAVQQEMKRLQRPFGGKICTGPEGNMQVGERGPLEGSGSWTHQNSNPANTLCSDDAVIRGPLSMYWFRDVDFEVPNRHGQGPAPLCHQGCMVVGGIHGIICLDAYNGRTLWTHELKGNLADFDGIHHDVGVGEAGSNFCLSDDAVFLKNADRCFRIDLLTGEVLGEFKTPAPDDKSKRELGVPGAQQRTAVRLGSQRRASRQPALQAHATPHRVGSVCSRSMQKPEN